MLKHQFVTPNIKGALGRGFLLPHSQFILLKNVNFKLEATKLECPGARACETNGFVEKLLRIATRKKLLRIATQAADLGLHALLYYSHLAPISSA